MPLLRGDTNSPLTDTAGKYAVPPAFPARAFPLDTPIRRPAVREQSGSDPVPDPALCLPRAPVPARVCPMPVSGVAPHTARTAALARWAPACTLP